MDTYAIKMEHIQKGFSGVPVLKEVDFELKEGEIHALLGENGAGKSTLIKILSGAHEKDSGTVKVFGKEVEIHNPQDAHALGIQCIYQELSLIPHLTVADNIFLGRELGKKTWINERKTYKEAQKMMEMLSLDIDVKSRVQSLGIGAQFFTEICRCLLGKAKIVILDEPTSAMTPVEYNYFLRAIKKLREQHISVIYISHRLDEIKDICDRVTILRDGKNIRTADVNDISIPEIIQEMVGKDASGYLRRQQGADLTHAPVIMKVDHVSSAKIQDISFELKAGEILGVTGLLGAGKTELANVIFGVDKKTKGTITIEGKEYTFKNPLQAMKAGIGLVPEDRKKTGLFQEFDIKSNIAIVNLDKMERGKVLVQRTKEKELAEKCVKDMSVKCNNINQKMKHLSGGNQQKVVLSKWIARNPKVLLLDEPTRGIDVGSKEEIYNLIRELANEGMAVMVLSSEMPEVLALSDRILILHDRKCKGEIPGEGATQEEILMTITGGKDNE